MVKSNGVDPIFAGSTYYLHRDYLGSIVAITDNMAAIVEKRHFDSWGNISTVQDGSGNALGKLTFLDRGYTGHEHLQGVGLINMNARLYDPKLHRLLQPDNFIQNATSTIDYNRYTYARNNPMSYVDTDGNNPVAIAIGVGVALAGYFITTHLNHQRITAGGITNAIFWGFMSSAVSFGVGEITTTITSVATRAAVQAVLHGATQGGLQSIQGGSFWNGFATGSVSSLAASTWSASGSFANSPVGMVTFGTVSGGFTSELTGGNFWEGAATGLVVSGLNHALHDNSDYEEADQQGKRATKKSLGIKPGDDNETMVNKMLDKMKIGEYIDGEDLAFLGKGLPLAISNIERVSNTDFRVTPTWAGKVQIDKGATITLTRNTTIEGNYVLNGVTKSYKGTGVKVTLTGVPYAKYNGKSYNNYIINGNENQFVNAQKNLIRWVQ